MPVKTVTCYIAVCDGCGKEHEYDYTPHWPTAREAIDETQNISDWWSDDTLLFCDECRYKPHAAVPLHAGSDADCARCGNPVEEHDALAKAGAE